MLEQIFLSVLVTSGVGTMLAFLLYLLRPRTEKYFSPGWHYSIWLSVLLVMILPIRIDDPKLFSLSFGTAVHPIVEEKVLLPFEEDLFQVDSVSEDGIVTLGKGIKVFFLCRISEIAFLWFAVAVALFLLRVFAYHRFLFQVYQKTQPYHCSEITKFMISVVPVRKGAWVHSPFMIGVFRPVLLLPETSMAAEQMKHVLIHEMIHYQRKDLWWKWLICLIKSIHWFNPVVYWISGQVNAYCEISCDWAVVKNMNEQEKLGYMETILMLLSAEKKLQGPLSTGILGNKAMLKRRFFMICNKREIGKKNKKFGLSFGVILLTITLFSSGVLADNVLELKAAWDRENDLQADENIFMTRVHPISGNVRVFMKNTGAKESVVDLQWPCPTSNQISAGFHIARGHEGIDIVTDKDVVSATSGVVTDVGFSADDGNYIKVLGQGNVLTYYAHLASIDVKQNDIVSMGEKIGRAGNTGKSTGSHLHFGIFINGTAVDPGEFFSISVPEVPDWVTDLSQQ